MNTLTHIYVYKTCTYLRMCKHPKHTNTHHFTHNTDIYKTFMWIWTHACSRTRCVIRLIVHTLTMHEYTHTHTHTRVQTNIRTHPHAVAQDASRGVSGWWLIWFNSWLLLVSLTLIAIVTTSLAPVQSCILVCVTHSLMDYESCM